MKNTKKILHVAAEAAPFAKVGGLADVVGSLPIALNNLDSNFETSVVIPCYELIDKEKFNLQKMGGFVVDYQNHKHPILVWHTKKDEADFYFIENKKFLGGSQVYLDVDSSSKKTGVDSEVRKEAQRFEFFCIAVEELIEREELSCDIVHCHDWHSAPLVPFTDLPTVYTIHNLANQGPGSGKDNYMELGIRRADIVTTVSPSYRNEILTREFGRGLEEVLAQRNENLYGIINGLNYGEWDPEADEKIKENFSQDDLSAKFENKVALQKELGLKEDKSKMLIGAVSRLTPQKGLKITSSLFSDIEDVQWVILGTGQDDIEKALKEGAENNENAKAVIDFNLELARKIYAGSDLFFMPSRFEPCGLGQMIAMRYGSLPLVRAVGGLKDTVNNLEDGFVFEKDDEVEEKVIKARDIYYNQPDKWKKMQEIAMSKDFSWSRSAKEYLKLYQKLS